MSSHTKKSCLFLAGRTGRFIVRLLQGILPYHAQGTYRVRDITEATASLPIRQFQSRGKPEPHILFQGNATDFEVEPVYHVESPIIARSKAMREALSRASRAGKYNEPVLILGETGTGKTILARSIHESGKRDGLFRRDLYERINVITITLPPLRERPDDVEALIDKTIQAWNREYSEEKHLSESARGLLCRYSWPGNVRELLNAIRSAAAIACEKRSKNDSVHSFRKKAGAKIDGKALFDTSYNGLYNFESEKQCKKHINSHLLQGDFCFPKPRP